MKVIETILLILVPIVIIAFQLFYTFKVVMYE